jgi:eukaryotic-like serine/threonine-protein kinase
VAASSRSADELLKGVKLPERYRLGRHIATGGMASVWCADDLVLGRTVAIKVLSERFARDHVAVARFEREARTAARVSGHPHVATIYDVGEAQCSDADADAGAASPPIRRTFIVMEHLAGGTVADALRVGEVRLQEAVRWLREAASALDHAHERGIVHRDIKPANFLLDGARVLHVADFGIARLGSEDTITSAGELFGTAAYLSPEQALGRAASPASDRYALAVAAYELLVGQRPFNATHFTAQARQHIEQPPPAASERNRVLPPAVDTVLQRALAKRPDERYATAAAFVDGLDAALSQKRASPTRRRVTTAHRRAAPRSGPTRPTAHAGRPLSSAAAPAEGADQPAARHGDGSGAGHGTIRGSGTGTGHGAARGAASATGNEAARGAAGATQNEPARGAASATQNEPARGAAGTTGHGAARGAGVGGPGVGGPRRRGRAIALGALATAALGVGALAAQSQGGGHGERSATTRARARQLASRTPARRPRTNTATTSARAADTLEAQGHQLMLAGAYSAAIPTLRRAVLVAPQQSLTYGYALYDLGRSLVLSGNPRAAVPILERRLKIPNQTQVVQQMLQLALRASNGGTGVTSSSSSTTSTATTTSTPPPTTTTTATIQAPTPPRHDAGHGPAGSSTGSGGAGIPGAPGQTGHARRRDHRNDRRHRH